MVGLWANLAIAAALLLAAFAIPQSPQSSANAWLTAFAITILAFAAPSKVGARRLLTAAAVWIFLSALVLPQESDATAWVSWVVAIAVFVLSVLPGVWTARTAQLPPQA